MLEYNFLYFHNVCLETGKNYFLGFLWKVVLLQNNANGGWCGVGLGHTVLPVQSKCFVYVRFSIGPITFIFLTFPLEKDPYVKLFGVSVFFKYIGHWKSRELFWFIFGTESGVISKWSKMVDGGEVDGAKCGSQLLLRF